MTTPELLEEMLVSARVDERALFSDLRMIVIDEVHARAGTDRRAHLMSVIERIRTLSRHDVQMTSWCAAACKDSAGVSSRVQSSPLPPPDCGRGGK